MNKIYFITKTWHPSKTGGSLMRQKQVEIFKKNGYEVIIVTPNYNSKEIIIENEIIKFPFTFSRKYSLGQRIGLLEDYLDKWVDLSFKYLKELVTEKDIIFATSGGELGTFKLGSLLKNYKKCRLIVNYRDPISYSLVHGRKVDKKFHISREKKEYKYIQNADLISTSSKTIQNNLKSKYPDLSKKILNHYFGYINKIDLLSYEKIKNKKLFIGYGGSFSSTQQPEILIKSFKKINSKSKVQITYIGNHKNYLPLKKDTLSKQVGPFEHTEFIKYMIKNIDVGFVSLSNDYFGACVPSKIYEYINLGLPILAALPKGDAKDLIEKNGFGLCYSYDDYEGIAKGIEKFVNDRDFFEDCKENILKKREEWSMNNLFSICIKDIKKIIS